MWVGFLHLLDGPKMYFRREIYEIVENDKISNFSKFSKFEIFLNFRDKIFAICKSDFIYFLDCIRND